jgi:rare lipoprotein A (peptidoglycan hydrolase)
VTVKINDRGPYSGDRCFQLTSGAYAKIASLSTDATTVDYQVLY